MLLCSCGKKGEPDTEPTQTVREQLLSKYELYNALMLSHADSNGFVDTDKCDSLLETALTNPNANIFAAEVEPGTWLRRPQGYIECFAAGESRSTISRDQLLGVMLRCVNTRNIGCLKRLWDHGESTSWRMGENGWEHSIFTPDYIAVLAQAIYEVSRGKNDYTARWFKFPVLSPETGYKAQLQVLFLMLREKVYGSLDSSAERLFDQLADQNPRNPLMQVAAGRHDQAANILLNEWPNGRLPTSSDWCTNWKLSEAPTGNGLKPCPEEGRVHSGGDLLFVGRIILNMNMLR